MKYITLIALSLMISACSSSDKGDEYDYIDTPIADQWQIILMMILMESLMSAIYVRVLL